ncbi:hypothetical protein Fbal_3107 [Ferrimonas balearica DSM 9799]|uniref:Uncharacterized protein n=1 Tax=Ferrimonas balearica (strain DSM 9799 / CCM 4581 / KCTC 23876 / PAT) TaxID=550540 RepID=E1SUJ9_FERBD|nr:hypothetical protein Fbal_3107 [Ferrimonas balearica DSM 9799]
MSHTAEYRSQTVRRTPAGSPFFLVGHEKSLLF